MPRSSKQNSRLELPTALPHSGGYMPWRANTTPYYILVSEVMLQQTQVDRVIPKFESFMKAFPTLVSLASARFKDVLGHWNGLGYNRRALWLHQAAQEIIAIHNGIVPNTIDQLVKLKGIGKNTAAAICVYAYNQPHVFVETNIRAVFIHHYFHDSDSVSDNDLLPLLAANIDRKNPRIWYWSLMDYGRELKKMHKNPARKSKHHTKQSTFEGSKRQLRGMILRNILAGVTRLKELESIYSSDSRFAEVLTDLQTDGLVLRDGDTVMIA